MAETKLHPGIPVTYEFENFIPPEEDGVIFEEPARQWQTTAPDVASMFDDEKTRGVLDKDRREAFVSSQPKPEPSRPKVSTGRPVGQKNLSRRTMSDVAGASSDPQRNLDSATGGSPARRTMSDVAGASSGAEGNLDYATGGSPARGAGAGMVER